ncbi:sugar transferase [Collinsella sp. AM28-11LB]|nr:sugar transferase [Collinsella sp. AM28-11LB]
MTVAAKEVTESNAPVGVAVGAGAAAVAEPVSLPGSPEFAAESRALDSRPLGYRFVKRTFDIAFSAFVCAVGLIPGAVLCAFIAADTKGAPIYAHERAGRFGRPIHVLKFRSMVADANDVEKYLTPAQIEEWHRERKVTDDPRITKLGRVLRKTSLDEIPQFINVLLGQLSVIGPRAVTYEELDNYTPEQQRQLLAVPLGITGAWQSGPRNEATFENGERQRLELDYARSASLGHDFGVFFATFGVMFGKNKTGR